MATRSLVVKIGTTSVTDVTGGVAQDALEQVARDVVELRDQHPPAQAILFPDFTATITRTPEFSLVRYRSGIPVGVGQRQLRLRNLERAAPAILIDG